MLEILSRVGYYRRILRVAVCVLRVINMVPANRKFSVHDAMTIAPTELKQATTHTVAVFQNALFYRDI